MGDVWLNSVRRLEMIILGLFIGSRKRLASKIEALNIERRALRGQLGYMRDSLHICNAGWVCEAHLHKPFGHDSCPGPGVPCGFRKSESLPSGSAHGNSYG